jgi:hypothetical protein
MAEWVAAESHRSVLRILEELLLLRSSADRSSVRVETNAVLQVWDVNAD